jgi:hypothetical protein
MGKTSSKNLEERKKSRERREKQNAEMQKTNRNKLVKMELQKTIWEKSYTSFCEPSLVLGCLEKSGWMQKFGRSPGYKVIYGIRDVNHHPGCHLKKVLHVQDLCFFPHFSSSFLRNQGIQKRMKMTTNSHENLDIHSHHTWHHVNERKDQQIISENTFSHSLQRPPSQWYTFT